MSGRELHRIEIPSEVLARRRIEISAAAILGLSPRSVKTAVVDKEGKVIRMKWPATAAIDQIRIVILLVAPMVILYVSGD